MLPHEFLLSVAERLQAAARQFIRVSSIFVQEWLLGPHGPRENRGLIGSFGLTVIESRLWERIFLVYILFNSVLKLTWTRDITCDYDDLLNLMSLWACLIFTFELLFGILVYGVKEFFSQKWFIADTVATFFNWTSYAVSVGYLPQVFSFIFPNIMFIRMLRFLKPLGRMKALIASKIVVKTVADAVGSMIPVLSLVFFCTLLFAIIGINLFGRRGLLRYRCGVPLSPIEAMELLTPEAQDVLNFKDCLVNMDYYMQFLNDRDADPEVLRDLTVNGSAMTCVATTPSTYCKCEKGEDDTIPFVCVERDGNCESGLCFRGASYVWSSPLHTFENFLGSAMSVISFLYLKGWTDYFIAGSVCAGPLFGYFYFFTLVIFGSFCLLNLTVATVSEAYSKVKKLTNAKQKRLDEERLEKERLEADREEMKRQAKRSAQDHDASNEEPLLFDTRQAYKYWLIGLLILFPCLHRCYFKDWNSGKWFVLRVSTFNYLLLGWILDGPTMNSINESASKLEQERIENLCNALAEEKDRILLQLSTPSKTRSLIMAISYPLKETPSHWTINYLQEKIMTIKERQGTKPAGVEDNNSAIESTNSLDSTSEVDEITTRTAAKGEWTQSLFAWNSDLVVVINAVSMAMQGFGPHLNPIITAIGYFATVYFIVESVLKCIAYGGFRYYLADQPNQLDFFLVVIPTLGEIICQITKALPQTNYREDFIYPMLVLRALRVLRILKLTKHMKDLKDLAQRAFGSPAGVIFAFLVTISFIVLVALFGNQLFRKSLTFAEARNDFQFIMEAVKALIENLFGDRYVDSIDAGYQDSNFVGVLFFIIYYYIGNFVILRIFIAIILENFEYSEEKKICLQIQLYQRHQILSNDLIDGTARPMSFQETLDRLKKQNLNEEGLDRDTERWKKILEHRAAEKGKLGDQAGEAKMLWDVIIDAFNSEAHPKPIRPKERRAIVEFMFRILMAFRRMIYNVVENEQFSLFVAGLIVFSVVVVIIDSPQGEYIYVMCITIAPLLLFTLLPFSDPLYDIPTPIRQAIDYSLLAFFATEVGAKIFAYGFLVPSGVSPRTVQYPEGKPAFFSNSEEGGWNILDAVFILIMLMDMPFIPISTGNFKVIRIVRIVRPLARNSSKVKTLLASLFASVKSILNVINLFALLVLIYGLLGVQLFKGRLHSCNDLNAGGFSNCVGNIYGGFPYSPCYVASSQKCVSSIRTPEANSTLPSTNISDIHAGNTSQDQDRRFYFTNGSLEFGGNSSSENETDTNANELCPQNSGFFLGQEVLVPRVWDVPSENFENFGFACITLLRLFATDNMRSIYHSIMDIPGITDTICSDGSSAAVGCPSGTTLYTVSPGPQVNNMPQNALYGMTFIFIANAFISQLVIGVLIDNIRRQSGSALYTETQRIWIATAKTLSRLALKHTSQVPEWPPRKLVYEKVASQGYDTTIMIVVIFNTMWMATEHDPRSPAYVPLVFPVEMVFLAIYIMDLLLKMFAIGVIKIDLQHAKLLRRVQFPFFSDPWNSFDFFIVLMSLIDLSLPKIDLSFFKLLRVLRVFKLVNKVKTLKIMITTLLGAVKSILAALLFLGIWLFIFAAIANDKMMFKNVRYGYGVLSATWNFTNIVNSMILLFKVTTGDSWFNLMYDVAVSYPYCTKLSLPVQEEWILSPFCSNLGNPPVLAPGCLLVNDYFTDTYIISDCGLNPGAFVFLAIYYFGCVFIFLPLFIATLIDYFTNPSVQVETLSLFNGDDCELFAEVWNEFDPKLEGEISIDNLRPFVDRLHTKGHRVGFKVSSDLARFKKIWARIMTDPAFFPSEGVLVEENERRPDKVGLELIDRSSMVKAFGLGKRATCILDYLQKHCSTFKEKRGREVRFEYAARVLCVYQKDIVQPLTTADLVNLGSAVQMFMGLIGSDEVKGNEGKENIKWKPLAVHNQLQEDLDTVSRQNAETAGHSNGATANYDDLPKILHAIAILQSDLYPKPIPGHEWKVKSTPTGAKRNELMIKKKQMHREYENIMERFICEALWGIHANNSKQAEDLGVVDFEPAKKHSSVLDELLDGIVQSAASKYASKASKNLSRILTTSAARDTPQKRYTQAAMITGGPLEPLVTTVPRGWLNSGKSLTHKRMLPSTHVHNHADATLSSLRQLGGAVAGNFSAARGQPVPPTRQASLALGPSEALRQALKAASKNDAWRQCRLGQVNKDAHATVWSLGDAVNWKDSYQGALRQLVSSDIDPSNSARHRSLDIVVNRNMNLGTEETTPGPIEQKVVPKLDVWSQPSGFEAVVSLCSGVRRGNAQTLGSEG